MRIHPRLFALLLVTVCALRADASLDDAFRARDLLGSETWARVVRIENTTRGSRYPAVLDAMIFEFAGILWFYTDVDGTQSLSVRRDRLENDKADLGPLLRAIEPGFGHWSVIEDGRKRAARRRGGALLNGCFVESIAALRERLAAGEGVDHPQLLSFYLDARAGGLGHTVLTYETRAGVVVVDPSRPAAPQLFSKRIGADGLALARAIAGDRVGKVRWLPVPMPMIYDVREPARVAAAATTTKNSKRDT